jgi:caffeoyl-CoA O-methyltransferase
MDIVDPRVEAYAAERTSALPELFERLAEETRAKTTVPEMMVGEVEGRFLGFLVSALRARRVLELGTFTGYSSICMALELPDGGLVTTLDVNEATMEIARRYAAEAGVIERIDYRLGPAIDTLGELEGPFDFVFIDADKEGYVDYYEATLPMLADGGLIAADNVLWSGRVVGDDLPDSGRSIQRFNEHVRRDERVESVMLTVRDGITLIRKR